MFKHILMPVDDSPASRKALQRTIAFAGEIGARLTAYHALPPKHSVYGEGYRFPQASNARDEIQQARTRLLDGSEREARAAGVPFQALVDRAASPEDGILQAAKRSKCDAIFMGTNGRRGLARVALGSVASRVIAASPVPVLVYR